MHCYWYQGTPLSALHHGPNVLSAVPLSSYKIKVVLLPFYTLVECQKDDADIAIGNPGPGGAPYHLVVASHTDKAFLLE